MRRAALVLIAALAATAAAQAQDACPTGSIPVNAVLEELKSAARRRASTVAAEANSIGEREPNPRAAKQVQAPSTAHEAAGPVDSPALGGLLALALDSGVAGLGQDSAVTVSLTPFALLSARRPEVLDDQAEYERHSLLRRIEGAITLGGKGESFDRDGDGAPDPAQPATDLGDSIAWEARVRVLGSRDRRERSYRQDLEDRATGALVAENQAYAVLIGELQREDRGHDAATQCWDSTRLRQALETPALTERLLSVRGAAKDLGAAVDDLLRDVDRNFILTLFAGGVHREDVLGPDRQTFGLRMAGGFGSLLDHTLNVDWMREELSPLGARPQSVKVGYEAKGEVAIPGFESTLVGLAGAWERHGNVPAAKHRTVFKVGGKVDIGLGRGVRIPISVTWANHADLLTGHGDVIGNIGIGFDLLDKAKGGTSK